MRTDCISNDDENILAICFVPPSLQIIHVIVFWGTTQKGEAALPLCPLIAVHISQNVDKSRCL